MPDAPAASRRTGRRGLPCRVAAIALVVVAGACSDDDDADPDGDTAIVSVPGSTDPLLIEVTPPLELGASADPEFLGEVLADDVVTAEELADAYDRYLGCLAEGGAAGIYAFDLDLRVLAADWLVEGAEGDDQAALDATCKRDFLGDLIPRFNDANPPDADLADRQRASVVACVEAIDPGVAAEIPQQVTLDSTEQGVSVIDLQLDATALGADEGEVDAVNRCTGALGAQWHEFG